MGRWSKYGALLWSGDIDSTFDSLRRQIIGALNSSVVGIAWWTSDIGGFRQGDVFSEEFREVFVRWLQWACFCPVMRNHGWRKPSTSESGHTDERGIIIEGSCVTNELCDYGDTAYDICKRYVEIRNNLRPYILKAMKEAHEKGLPVIRPLCFDFSKDKECYKTENDLYVF